MNLPNKLTLFRIFLTPVFVIVIYLNIPHAQFYAAAVFVIAAITDLLDGYIARKRNMVTEFGKFMDPLADKIMVSTALIVLLELGKIPGWALMVVICREFIISGIRLVAVRNNVTISASKMGKIKTVTQIVSIVLLLLNNYPFSIWNIRMDMILFYLSVILTLLSGINYMIKNRKVIGFVNK